MTTQGPARRSRRRILYAGAGASVLLPMLAVAAWPGTASAAAPKVIAGVTLSAAPLGVDAGVWDPILSNTTATSTTAPATSPAVAGTRTFADVEPLLKLAGIDQLRYSSGSVSDEYDWQNNVAISNCPTTATSQFFTLPSCVYSPALPFALVSADARALGAQTAVTVNYGSGTESMAAQWVTQAQTPGEAVSSWEIGNESYGCWEDNNALAGPPANYPNYVPDDTAVCPMDQPAGDAAGLQIMATSYAVNAGQFMTAMKEADPSAQLGVPWAFDATVGGAVVENNAIWNNTVLGTDGPDIGFVDAHWYPYTFGGDIDPATNHHTDQGVIQSVETIPSEYAKIQAELNTYDPGAKVVVGETGVSFNPTNVPCIPAGALFAAGDVLSWLAAGAQSVNWWPLDTSANLGDTCVNADEGMFTNTGSPLTPYYGYLLASALAQPDARLSTLATSDPSDVLAFQAELPSGRIADALINTNTSNRETVKTSTALTGSVSTESYSAGDQNASNSEIVTGTTTASAVDSSITLPAESITILNDQPPAVILDTTSRAGTFIKAGTKVTLSGKLTLDGTPAPAGTPVEIFRQVSTGKGSAATLLARTTAGGAFKVTDLPPAWGIYTYFASYTSRAYQPASQAFLVHVTIARPSLKLALSAKSVKPGKKVLVTATLGAMHVNRTLVIYAQPKGGRRRVIKRASANSKGQVAVVFPVKANTTFTVTFAGDTWYTPATASAVTVVKS